jgi:hypothetical protein
VFAVWAMAVGLSGSAHVAGWFFSDAWDPFGREASDVGSFEVAGVAPLDLVTVPGDEGPALLDVDFEDLDRQDTQDFHRRVAHGDFRAIVEGVFGFEGVERYGHGDNT